jgi:hypothetical protein
LCQGKEVPASKEKFPFKPKLGARQLGSRTAGQQDSWAAVKLGSCKAGQQDSWQQDCIIQFMLLSDCRQLCKILLSRPGELQLQVSIFAWNLHTHLYGLLFKRISTLSLFLPNNSL